jgi:YVTN family beta-propeller protein
MRGRLTALLVLAAVALLGCGNSTPAPPPSTLRTGVNPVAVAERNGAVWVANAGEGTVWKLDEKTGRRLATVRVGDAAAYGRPCEARNIHQVPHGDFAIRSCDLPRGMALGDSGLWVTANDRAALLQVNPASARVVREVPIGIQGWYVAVTPGAVWVSDFDRDVVVRVDPKSGHAVATIPVPLGPTQIVTDEHGVWVACSRADAVARIDPATNQVAATIPVGHTPVGMAAGSGSIWVRNNNTEHPGSVSRIDTATGAVTATIPVGLVMGRDGLDGLAATAGGIWVPGLDLEKIDPRTDRVVRHVNHTANAVVAGQTGLWTIDVAYSVSRRPLG